MYFKETPLEGAYLINLQRLGDERGFFGRVFCVNEFAEHDLTQRIVQMSNSFNAEPATLRGMHYQLPPKSETKIVRCIRGGVWDCILDLRQDSPTFGQWFGAELTAENRQMMYVPKGFAHGFVTLTGNTELLYMMDEFYGPDCERGICWDDEEFGIQWPLDPKVMSEKDRAYPKFDPEYHLVAQETIEANESSF